MMAYPLATAFGRRYAPILDLVTLCYVSFGSLFQDERSPATMIGFKQIEFFDHTGTGTGEREPAGCESKAEESQPPGAAKAPKQLSVEKR
jgi:hypothetical protein